VITQYGVLAYETAQDGEPRFLLITSRTTKRWIIPRGNPIRGLSPSHSAAQEAYEEAGLTGFVGAHEIGSYPYVKRRRNGSSVPARVHVFPLSIPVQSSDWPERHERQTRWFTRAEAAEAVEEEDLKALIRTFAPPEASSAFPGSWFAPIRAPLWARLLRRLKRPWFR
jgi:8-oxo-dGTP pyrophosphatase MutT (NUDIX family)